MKWTTELPTEDGWYWWRFKPGDRKQVVQVFHGKTFKVGASAFGTPAATRGEWYGPVSEPPDDAA